MDYNENEFKAKANIESQTHLACICPDCRQSPRHFAEDFSMKRG